MNDIPGGMATATDGRLTDIIRAQFAAFEAATTPPVERVAARVRRVAGFGNVGTAASGHALALDEPVAFGGGGTGADPAEAMLIAIGASLSVTLTVQAALAGIALDEVDVALAGELDPARFFRPSPEPGGGVDALTLDVSLAARADEATLAALLDRALQACPVLRSIDARPAVKLVAREVA